MVFRKVLLNNFSNKAVELMGLPYWDSSLDNNLEKPFDSIMFSEFLMGTEDKDGNIFTGPFANWTTMDVRTHFLFSITFKY